MINISDTKQLTVKLALQSGNYKQQIKSINAQNKLLQSEFKNLNASSKDFEKTLDGKKAKLKLLGTQYDNAKQKVSIYKGQVDKCKATLDDATKSYTEQEAKVKNLSKQLDDAKSTYGENSEEVKKLEKELRNAEKTLESKRNAVINADNSLTNMNRTLNDAQLEVNRLEQELKDVAKTTNSFSVNMQKVSDATGEFSKRTEKIGTGIQNAGKKISIASAAVTGVGVASIKTAADFESSMSQVAATMGMTAEEINKGSEDYKRLEKAALEMGSSTMFSASEAAEALNYLALAGYDVDKSISTLPIILDLAASGGIDLASASDMVTDAMSALGDAAGTAESFVDKMAKTSQKSNTSVAQLGEGILTVGGTAKVLAGETNELNTSLGILADNGIKGAEGGTALRNIILSLTAPTDKAAGAMKKLGLEVLDAEGNMRPINAIMGDLNDTLGSMSNGKRTQVLNEIFNKVDLKSVNALLTSSVMNMSGVNSKLKEMGVDIEANADMLNYLGATFEANEDKAIFLEYAIEEMGISVEQATVLYDELNDAVKNGGSRFEELEGYINNSENAASNMAETMQNNLNGQITSLKSAIEGAMITIGNQFLPALKSVTDKLNEWVTWFNNANSSIQKMIIGVGVFIAILGPVILLLGTFILAISQITGAISLLTGAIANAGGLSIWFSTTLLPLISTLGIIIGVVITLAMSIKENWEGIKSATSDLISSCSPYFEQFKLAFSDLWTTCQSIYSTVIQPLFKIIGEVIAVCISSAIPIIQALLTTFTVVFNTISSVWNSIGQPVFKFMVSIIQNVWNTYKPVLNNISNAFSSMVNAISSIYNGVLKPIFNTFMSIVKTLVSVVTPAFNSIRNVITTCLNAVLTPIRLVTNAFSGLMNIVSNVSKGIGGALSKVGNLFKGKSVDMNINQGTSGVATLSRSVIPSTEMLNNVAMSGSYYTSRSSLSETIGKMSNINTMANRALNSAAQGLKGININTNSDTSKLELLMVNMIELLSKQNSLIESNKPIFEIDGQQLSSKLDKIGGMNMKLYERFDL